MQFNQTKQITFYDNEEQIDLKIDELKKIINSSLNLVLLTGSGISNQCDIESHQYSFKQNVIQVGNQQDSLPNVVHLFLLKLVESGIIKHIVSQNTDGLLRKVGIQSKFVTEIQGNDYLEICQTCRKEYLREFKTRTANQPHDHKTNRKCDKSNCRGDLFDQTICYGEPIYNEEKVQEIFQSADAIIVLGSSLRLY